MSAMFETVAVFITIQVLGLHCIIPNSMDLSTTNSIGQLIKTNTLEDIHTHVEIQRRVFVRGPVKSLVCYEQTFCLVTALLESGPSRPRTFDEDGSGNSSPMTCVNFQSSKNTKEM